MIVDHFKKKWLIVVKVNVDGVSPGDVHDFMSSVKKALPQETFDKFFESSTMCLYLPIVRGDTNIEFHEIILNGFGYDKYELIVKDNNLTIKNILDSLKELLDDNEK